MTEMTLSQRTLQFPNQSPRLFLLVAAAIWFALYQALAPASEALVAALPVDRASHLGGALQFFVYDTPKVLLLLTLVVFVMGMVNSYFTPERTRAMLAGKTEGVANVMAASLGIVTPFCSCSAVPLFIGFVQAGVPLGVTFSFLISAPMDAGQDVGPDLADDLAHAGKAGSDALGKGQASVAGGRSHLGHVAYPVFQGALHLQPADDPAGDDGHREAQAEVNRRDLPAEQAEQQRQRHLVDRPVRAQLAVAHRLRRCQPVPDGFTGFCPAAKIFKALGLKDGAGSACAS